MNTTLISIAAALLVATATTALDPANFDREPNVLSGFCVPYNWLGDAPSCFDPDNNGVADARANGGGRVLDAKWVVGLNPAYLDLNVLFDPWFGGEYILPGMPGNFLAHYGDWTDADWDGSLGPGEWSGVTGANLVSYVTPAVPVGGVLYRTGGSNAPDVIYVAALGPEGARYVGSAPFVVFVDHSVLETTAVWTLVDPTLGSGGGLTMVPTPGNLWDTDYYKSIDPLLESLYQNSVQGTI